ncbi:MAG: hypothetical protein AVDCRST_MAG89-4689 [uncultured Gemmatimonadetes bacterium]|uniref:Tryptophan synthase beta chain-like PALP domain-containing protein n=1 Tax=uncultured Gemmatimonadota bacterium TaxID=203437 RepID=A0A6J4MZV8_9BACT|nr:MAG: hypothetical protein AVDCRST_MAG89-4689 [uncultured Gemmatimonadota bacterium]
MTVIPQRALFRRFPALAKHLPWIQLGSLPTPVQQIELPGRAELWVKRDDLSGEQYGGNKVRKLEFILAEAQRRESQRLITVGAAGSHHALATAVFGRLLGLQVTLVLFPQPLTPHVRDVLLLDQAFGAELRWAPRMELIPAAALLARVAHRRERCFVIAPGGSDPLGTLGYVDAALELAEQIKAGECPLPGTIHVAAGTLGTTAGLALGFALAGLPIHIRATRITSCLLTNRVALRRLVVHTGKLLRSAGVPVPTVDPVLSRVRLVHDQIGPGYGHPTPAAEACTGRLASAGLMLDPTYTSKAAADVLACLDGAGGGVHLLWQTLSAAHPRPPAPADAARLPSPFRRYLSG